MKAIQFVHPLFLVALGLHASVLFIPIGPDETNAVLIEEDVPLASIDDVPQPPKPSKPGALPVPDPNVTAGAAKIGTVPPALLQPTRVVTRQVPPSAAVTIRPATVPQPAVRSPSTNSANSAPPIPTEPVDTSEIPDSNLPDLTAGQTEEETTAANSSTNGSTETVTNSNASAEGPPSLPQLIASAQTDASSFLASLLEDLSDGLTYRSENTDEAIAQRNLEKWKASFSQQANTAQIENVEPMLITDIELAYPIESAETMSGGSLSVCLDEPPNNAQIGLLFGSDGELVESPMLIRSTGYDALNLEASALIMKDNNLPNNRAAKAYLYDVVVDYDAEACVSLKELKD